MKTVSILVVMLATAAGCKKSVKNEDVEKFIKKRTEELGLGAATVSCPKGVEAKVGNKFDCNVSLDGKTYVLVATVTEVKGSQLNIDTAWKDGEAVMAGKLAPALTDDLSKQFGTPVTIACGEALRFLDKDRNVACDMSAGATKAKVIITFDDKLNATNWKLDPQLLSKTKLEQLLTEPVRAKTAPSATITCGSEPLLPRPADGNVMCDLAGGDRPYKLKVVVEENLNVKNWEVVAADGGAGGGGAAGSASGGAAGGAGASGDTAAGSADAAGSAAAGSGGESD